MRQDGAKCGGLCCAVSHLDHCRVCCRLAVEGADTTIIGGETRVIDGDTLEVKGERVRLQGIDAPEKGQLCENASGKRYPYGQAVIRALRERIGDSNVACAIDAHRDRYGWALGYAPCAAGT